MNDNIVYRSTYTRRKWLAKRIWKSLECWHSTIIPYEFFRYLIQLESCNTRLDMFAYRAECFSNKPVGISHQLNLIFRFEKYLHSERNSLTINMQRLCYGHGYVRN